MQLDTNTKTKVSEVINHCLVELNGLISKVNLNILPLWSYNLLIGMDLLEPHRSKFDSYNKIRECFDDKGKFKVIQGILNPISIRQISTLQLRK